MWIFGGFLEARTLKNHEKPSFFRWFLVLFIKSKFSKKIVFTADLEYAKFHSKSIFGDMWAHESESTHIKEETDGRI